MIPFEFDDGGRSDAGFKGTTRDYGKRPGSAVPGRPYKEVYDMINVAVKGEKLSKRHRGTSDARTGIHAVTFHKIVAQLGAAWTPTMFIGSGTKVHVRAEELPTTGRHILRLSKHYAALVDGTLRDNHDCSRMGTRAVYGYWSF